MADMQVDDHWQGVSVPLNVPATASAATMHVSEYAVSTQGRGAELVGVPSAQSAEQRVDQRVNQRCAAQWQQHLSLTARAQFYEAVEWTARAEREQTGVAHVDVQAMEAWLQAGSQLQHEISTKSRQDRAADQRSRPERYRAKNLITKKRPAQLQRELVELLFSQISTTRKHERQHRDRESEERGGHREHDRHYKEREYERNERERRHERDQHRERRETRDHDKKRRHEGNEEYNSKRYRYR